MRNVERSARPGCLTRNGPRWTRELLEAVAGGDTQLTRRRASRYNKAEVRNALDTMYRNLCCYCESQVGPVRADQIEHRMPIDVFPAEAFEWENLHLACGGCNRAKSNEWDENHPILDAVADNPITDHLDYKSTETGIRRIWRTPRGQTTVRHACLNREKLREARTYVMTDVVGVIQEILRRRAKDPADAEAANLREELEERYTGRYGSMIRWAVASFLEA